jgi:hypothetical protein
MTERLAQTVQIQARAHPVAATFVADGRNDDLLFCVYRFLATHEGLCTRDRRRRLRWNLMPYSVRHIR